jgi:hypothetical protein
VSRHRLVLSASVVLLASALVPVLGSPSSDAATTTASRWPVGVSVTVSPLGLRGSPAIAVRGPEVFVVGGEKLRNGQPVKRMSDGAVLDLRTRKWTRLPVVPFHRTQTTTAITVGPDVLVAGVTCPGRVGTEHGCTGGRIVAAVYSTRTKRWRSLRVPTRVSGQSFGASMSALMSTHDRAWFLVNGTGTVAVNVHTGGWREIRPPLLGSAGSTCAARRYAAVFAGTAPMGLTALRLLTVDDRAWGTPVLPGGFADAGVGASPSCNAGSVVVVKGDMRMQACPTSGCTTNSVQGSPFASVQRYDLIARQWSTIAPPPFSTSAGSSGVGHGSDIDFFDGAGGPAVRLSTATGTWMRLAPGPQSVPSPIWANGVYVGSDDTHIVVYRPL